MCMERGEGRKEEKAGGRKLGGRRDKEGRKKEKKGGAEIIKRERDRQGDLARQPQEAHRGRHMESHRISNM